MESRCLFITVFFTRKKCVYTQKKANRNNKKMLILLQIFGQFAEI